MSSSPNVSHSCSTEGLREVVRGFHSADSSQSATPLVFHSLPWVIITPNGIKGNSISAALSHTAHQLGLFSGIGGSRHSPLFTHLQLPHLLHSHLGSHYHQLCPEVHLGCRRCFLSKDQSWLGCGHSLGLLFRSQHCYDTVLSEAS